MLLSFSKCKGGGGRRRASIVAWLIRCDRERGKKSDDGRTVRGEVTAGLGVVGIIIHNNNNIANKIRE